jgi:hypothetical protein
MSKPGRLFRCLAVLTLLSNAGLGYAEGNAGFEKLKTLVGEWEGQSPDGNRATVRYELVSAGSAVLERIGGGPHADMDMVTVYHSDGPRLVMTHYCSAGNQPRMRSEPLGPDAKSLHFAFLDVTNLSAPDAGHMHDLVVTFEDHDHFTQEWTWRKGGKDGREVFHWVRKK